MDRPLEFHWLPQGAFHVPQPSLISLSHSKIISLLFQPQHADFIHTLSWNAICRDVVGVSGELKIAIQTARIANIFVATTE